MTLSRISIFIGGSRAQRAVGRARPAVQGGLQGPGAGRGQGSCCCPQSGRGAQSTGTPGTTAGNAPSGSPGWARPLPGQIAAPRPCDLSPQQEGVETGHRVRRRPAVCKTDNRFTCVCCDVRSCRRRAWGLVARLHAHLQPHPSLPHLRRCWSLWVTLRWLQWPWCTEQASQRKCPGPLAADGETPAATPQEKEESEETVSRRHGQPETRAGPRQPTASVSAWGPHSCAKIFNSCWEQSDFGSAS